MTLGPLMIDLAGPTLGAADRELLRHPAIGGVILFTRNFEDAQQLRALTTEVHELRHPSLLIAVDQEGGRVQRFGEPMTRLPPARMLGQLYDTNPDAGLALAHTCGWLMAAELRACGVDLSFAPVLDLDRGLCSVIGDRAAHRDAGTVGRLGRVYMAGMHSAGMAATAKHFPGHGGVGGDSHVELPVDARVWGELRSDISPYEMLIGSGLESIMMALVAYPDVDQCPASLSARWIGDELRQRLGFTGAVFSDDLSMAGAAGEGSMRRRVRAALGAGCDMALICNDRDAVHLVVDRIEADNPASQARRASLHGRRARNWRGLRRCGDWQQARELVQASLGPEELELDPR